MVNSIIIIISHVTGTKTMATKKKKKVKTSSEREVLDPEKPAKRNNANWYRLGQKFSKRNTN